MCCFSGEVDKVSKTRIYARNQGFQQTIVYSMDLDTPEDVAMILPIPVKTGTEKIEFIDLSKQADFFEKIEALFPKTLSKGLRGRNWGSDSLDEDTLEVHQVGSYDASFVPTVDDMDRLDARFTIKKDIWEKVPGYENFGFVVFKLTKGDAERHPMGFRFDTNASNQIFFPTIHIHNGKSMPEEEEFDHTLYAQSDVGRILPSWPSTADVDKKFAGSMNGVVAAGKIFKNVIQGVCPNEDLYLTVVV